MLKIWTKIPNESIRIKVRSSNNNQQDCYFLGQRRSKMFFVYRAILRTSSVENSLWWSSFLSSWFFISKLRDWRSVWYLGQVTRTWSSSSIGAISANGRWVKSSASLFVQNSHLRDHMASASLRRCWFTGLWYLPSSIFRRWLLVLNLAIDFLSPPLRRFK